MIKRIGKIILWTCFGVAFAMSVLSGGSLGILYGGEPFTYRNPAPLVFTAFIIFSILYGIAEFVLYVIRKIRPPQQSEAEANAGVRIRPRRNRSIF